MSQHKDLLGETDIRWQVYNNLPVFMKYRGMEPSKKYKFMSREEFSAMLNSQEYVVVDGTIGSSNETFTIVIIAPNSNLTSFTKDFMTLTKKIGLSAAMKSNTRSTLFLITKNKLPNNIITQVSKIYEKTGKLSIKSYLYSMFSIIIPEHNAVPKHEILTPQEEHDLLKYLCAEKHNLPKIHIDDPPVVWIGGVVGNIIRIHRISDTTKTAIAYRVVIPTPKQADFTSTNDEDDDLE